MDPKPLPGLVLATRTDCQPRQLLAFLRHHMPYCEKAVISVDLRPGQNFEAIRQAVAAEFGDTAAIVATHGRHFSNLRTTEVLWKTIAGMDGVKFVMHIDKDEFVSYPEQILEYFDDLVQGKCDCASGWMACRFGAGLCPYPDGLPTYDAFSAAAPVRAEYIKFCGFPNRKIWLTRAPHICIHDPLPGWKVHESLMVLDHFTWTDSRLEMGAEKALELLAERSWEGWHDHAAEKLRLELEFVRGTPAFQAGVKSTFIPHSCTIPGVFDYAEIYQRMVESAPPDGTIVELGIFQGRSLCYLGEYAAVVAKPDLDIVGIDTFDPDCRLWQDVEKPSTSEQIMEMVRANIERCCCYNRPRIIQSDSSAAAASFPDQSIHAVWLDAGGDVERVTRDVHAWAPKIREGGILGGRDADRESVREGLRRSGIEWRSASERSWLATGGNFCVGDKS